MGSCIRFEFIALLRSRSCCSPTAQNKAGMLVKIWERSNSHSSLETCLLKSSIYSSLDFKGKKVGHTLSLSHFNKKEEGKGPDELVGGISKGMMLGLVIAIIPRPTGP